VKRRGDTNGKPFRFFIASDIHGAEGTWRKYLNALRMRVYRADAGLYAGDLTGKALVPIVHRTDGWVAELAGRQETAQNERELAELERRIADRGFYTHVCEVDEWRELCRDPGAVGELFRRKAVERVHQWMDLADERLGAQGPPIVLIPGNDDEPQIDAPLSNAAACVSADGRAVELGPFMVLGFSASQPTPWQTPRELCEEEIGARIEQLAAGLEDPARSVFLVHVPPHNSGLDTAPLLDENLRPTVSAGDILRGPVGSTAVRAAIERYRPLLGVHGHVHESAGHARVGATLCVNPGTEADAGVLRGYVVDIGADGVERVFRVEA
jgi:Icc-related predicted phosphoesterase